MGRHVAPQLAFDRGTLRLHGLRDPDEYPHAVWDERTGCHRAPAHRYAELRGHPDLIDDLAPQLAAPSGPWRMPPLRTYQQDAVDAWHRLGRRGVVVSASSGSPSSRSRARIDGSITSPIASACWSSTRRITLKMRVDRHRAHAGRAR